MSNLSKNIIAAAVCFLLLASAVVYSIVSSKTGIIPDNVIGNSAGNLNNHGLFAEYDGYVYFSNPYDNGALYKMASAGTDFEKLNDLNVKFINAGGKYVFFYGEPSKTTSGIGGVVAKPAMYRITQKGGKLKALTKDVTQNMVLVGNNIYYQHYTVKTGTTFAKIDLKDKSSTELLDYMINPSCFYNGRIFYNGMYDDHFLYSYNLADSTVECLWEGDIWNPIYDGQYVYYMDVQNNYRLCRYSFSDNVIEILTKDRIDLYNIKNGKIYYQKNSQTEPALKMMNLDGSDNEVIASGNFTDINVTDNYVFFKEFGKETPLYCMPLGSNNFREFTEALDAVREK